MIERGNPEWHDLFNPLASRKSSGTPGKARSDEESTLLSTTAAIGAKADWPPLATCRVKRTYKYQSSKGRKWAGSSLLVRYVDLFGPPKDLRTRCALCEKKAGSAPIWLNMLLLGLAVAYTASAGNWAFKELKVGVSYEPGLADLEKA